MESIDYWRLRDELTVTEAVLLIIGMDPSTAEDMSVWRPEERPNGYDATMGALVSALKKSDVDGAISPYTKTRGNDSDVFEGTVDPDRSTVRVESVRKFLVGRGLTSAFFQNQSTASPEYLNPRNPRYAPKLAAAVLAWQAAVDVKGRSPKQALEHWLREHAADFGLSDKDGKPNETGINETAKVANWQPGGGAPKTPTK